MARTAQNEQKGLTFIVVTLLRIKNIKERWRKNRNIYSKFKKIH